MQPIGSGLQSIVYRNGDSVRKVPASKKHIRRRLQLWCPWLLFDRAKLEDRVEDVIANRTKIIDELQQRDFNQSLCANIRIHGTPQNYVITQDYCWPLGDVLTGSDTELIKQFVFLQYQCWESGFSERTYNLTLNNGIDERAHMRVLDVGEVTFEFGQVWQDVHEQHWLDSHSFKPLLGIPFRLRGFYREYLAKHLTPGHLERYWRECPLRDH